MTTLDRVRAVIADALYVDVEDVQADSVLMADLGAESIDFLDIMFRLEKEFSITLPKGDIEKKARGGLSDEQYAVEGKLTEAALQNLRVLLPEVGPEAIRPGLTVRELPSLFTVATFARMVDEKLEGTSEGYPAASLSSSSTSPSAQV